MTRFALQFGQTQPGLTYLERMSAYGVCPRGEANIAVVRIGKSPPYEFDLPGGGVEGDEDEAAALMREFQEETGLTVVCGSLIDWAELISDSAHYVVLDFEATLMDDAEPVAGDDAAEVRWVPTREVCELRMPDGLAEFLHDHDYIPTLL